MAGTNPGHDVDRFETKLGKPTGSIVPVNPLAALMPLLGFD